MTEIVNTVLQYFQYPAIAIAVALGLWMLERLPSIITSWSELSTKLHNINATKQQLINSEPTATKNTKRTSITLLRLFLIIGLVCIVLPALSGQPALATHISLVASGLIFILVSFGIAFLQILSISLEIVAIQIETLSMQVAIDQKKEQQITKR